MFRDTKNCSLEVDGLQMGSMLVQGQQIDAFTFGISRLERLYKDLEGILEQLFRLVWARKIGWLRVVTTRLSSSQNCLKSSYDYLMFKNIQLSIIHDSCRMVGGIQPLVGASRHQNLHIFPVKSEDSEVLSRTIFSWSLLSS